MEATDTASSTEATCCFRFYTTSATLLLSSAFRWGDSQEQRNEVRIDEDRIEVQASPRD